MARPFFVVALALTAALPAVAADWTKPHPHQGTLKPFAGEPPPIKLKDAEKARLLEGKPVFRQMEDQEGTGGRGMAVFYVDAPTEAVWSVIADFKSYPGWIDDVKETKVYSKPAPMTGVQSIDVFMKIGRMGVSVEYFIHHVFHHDAHWATWTLDYSKESDLDDSIGFWRVTPVEGAQRRSMVEYSVDLKVKGWVPGFIKEALLDSGLKAATRWVKVQAEARAARAPVQATQPAPVPPG